jgi:hypothetical protein
MTSFRSFAAGMTACLLLAGCAGTKVARVSNPAYNVTGKYSDEDANGIRYYESAPFLLVYSDGKGGLNSQLLFLPDLTQKRVIDPYSVLASNNSTLTFVNGVLTQGKTVVDETMVPKAVIGTLERAAAAMIGGAFNDAGAAPTPQLPPPQLFRIILANGSARLVGGPGIDQDGKVRMIDVTVSNPDKPGAAAAPAQPATEEEQK